MQGGPCRHACFRTTPTHDLQSPQSPQPPQCSFDLDLPESFIPYNGDGEVESFTLMPLAEAIESLEKELYKCTYVRANVLASVCLCVCARGMVLGTPDMIWNPRHPPPQGSPTRR